MFHNLKKLAIRFFSDQLEFESRKPGSLGNCATKDVYTQYATKLCFSVPFLEAITKCFYSQPLLLSICIDNQFAFY